jgi:chorismate synthase
MVRLIERLRDEGNSVGGIVECRIEGVPAGLGEPVFNKLEAELAHGIMSLGAVKGFEIGSGFRCAEMTGIEHNDSMDKNGFLSNNAGGIVGGISNGETIIFRAAVKPTASVAAPQNTINIGGEEVVIRTEGRHDPCICPRIVPVIEAMSCLVIEDQFKLQAALFT